MSLDKPVIKKVVLERWDCGNPKHNHIKYDVALACIEARKLSQENAPYDNGELAERNKSIVVDFIFKDLGYTALSKKYGISPTRVRQIIMKVARKRGLDMEENTTVNKLRVSFVTALKF